MRFLPTPLPGVALVEPELLEDERGFFARCFCAEEFAAHGLDARVVQCSTSFTRQRGAVRGLHYQRAPYGETKLVRCTAGALWDVVVDLRPASAAFGRHFAVELSAANRRMLYVPQGVAHGFQTLADGTEVFYQMSAPHAPDAAAGVRWDDPALGIEWPLAVTVISARDRSYPDFRPEAVPL
jgi:dTDP-4-dehydrorhamnose 3,5-epimerase